MPKQLMKSDRVLGVLEVLASLLIGTQLLVTLSLQVPLQDLLKQVHVRPLGSQKHIARLWPQKHCKQTSLSYKYLYIYLYISEKALINELNAFIYWDSITKQ